jgi:glucan 1,3-beta-glucosidase
MSGEAPASTTNYDPVPNPSSPTNPEHPVAGVDAPYDPVEELGVPRPRFLGGSGANPSGGDPEIRASYASSNGTASQRASDYNGSVVGLKDGYRDDPDAEAPPSLGPVDEKNAQYAAQQSSRRRKALIWGGIATVMVIIIAVVLAVVFAVVKPSKHHNTSGSTETGSGSSSSSSGGSSGDSTPTVNVAITGGDGSTVTMDDGTTFTYTNKLGGYWYADPNDPYTSAAKPNSWTPALNETFKYGEDKIYGVNLGGWLVLEPFMCVTSFITVVSYFAHSFFFVIAAPPSSSRTSPKVLLTSIPSIRL